MNALEFKNVSIDYKTKGDSKRAVDDFSLAVKEGEFFGLLGPNGAGKTSLISATTGLIPFQSGDISIFDYKAGSRAAKQYVGVVPQEIISHGFFDVNEVLNFMSGYYGIRNNQKRIDFLLERLQLVPFKYKLVSQLSGGMKRRLLIAKALLHSPKILLLDEPSAGVDVELRSILWDFMRELNKSGTTIVLTTHYLEEAQRLCQRCAILNYGKLLALDGTGALISSMSERIVQLSLKNDCSPVQTPSVTGIVSVEKDGKNIKVVASSKLSLQEVLEAVGISLEEIADIRTSEGDLESAFLKLVKKGSSHAA